MRVRHGRYLFGTRTGTTARMMRPRIEGDDEKVEQTMEELVEEYADSEGIQKPRAYFRLLREGLQCQQADHETILDKKVPEWREEFDVGIEEV